MLYRRTGCATRTARTATLGHGNIATTSGYLHARPNTSSGLHLEPGVVSSMKDRAGKSAAGANRSPPCGSFTPIADKQAAALLTRFLHQP